MGTSTFSFRWLRALALAAALVSLAACSSASIPQSASLLQGGDLGTPEAAQREAALVGAQIASGQAPQPASSRRNKEGLAPKPTNLQVQLAQPSAEAYLVMDEMSGAVLAGKNERERRSPASLVKIMTALIAIERGRLEDMVEVNVNYMDMPFSTVMGLLPGERLSLRDLLYGLLLPSGNDAAVAIARHIAGSEEAFVGMMNRRAGELGLSDTHFTNSHGLDFGRYGQGYSTAYDLALLSREAMSLPAFREIAGTISWTARGKDQPYEMLNRNLLLYNYDGADGVKIGYTRRAGQTLVGSVTRNDRRVYAVVLSSQHRMTDAIRLFDYVFQRYQW